MRHAARQPRSWLIFDVGQKKKMNEDLLQMLRSHLEPNACGLEIGAHTIPVPGVTPYYLDRVVQFAGIDGRIDIQGDANALPIRDAELDYLCSSHVLEHLADPMSALWEWTRVLRKGGMLYLVVPDKRFTFDEPRTLTSVDHILTDFLNGPTEERNREHIREFIYDTDWRRLQPAAPLENKENDQRMHFEHWVRVLESGEGLDIHFHTFTLESTIEILSLSGLIGGLWPKFEVLGSAERFPPNRGDGAGLLLRKIRGKQRPTGRPTYSFPPNRSEVRPLSLVCPATLAPLHLQSDGRLTVEGHSHAYRLSGGVPDLIPNSGLAIQRKWKRKFWRQCALIIAKFKSQTKMKKKAQ